MVTEADTEADTEVVMEVVTEDTEAGDQVSNLKVVK